MWEITPLDLGRLSVTNSAQICRHGVFADAGKSNPGPIISWLLTDVDTGRNILVDSGPCDDTKWGSVYHNPVTRTKEQLLPNALAKHGIKCEDIDTVIITHLHWDHGYGVYHLPNARVIVQEKEIRYAVCPLVTDMKHYEIKTSKTYDPKFLKYAHHDLDPSKTVEKKDEHLFGENPYFLKFYNQMEFVDGDVENFEKDLDIITLPGHSPGHQGVVVHTPKGKFAIAGDCVNCYEAWELRWPCGLYSDMFANVQSIKKLDRLGCEVLCSHDYSAFKILGKPHADWVEYKGEYDHI